MIHNFSLPIADFTPMKKLSKAKMTRLFRVASKEIGYRKLKNSGERAHYLHTKKGLPRGFLIAKKVCTAGEWRRMTEAVKAGRPIGIRGRRPKLSTAQKEAVIRKAISRSKTTHPMVARDISALVYLFLLSSLIFFFLS